MDLRCRRRKRCLEMLSVAMLVAALGLMAVFGSGCSGSISGPSAGTLSPSGLVVAVRPNNPSFVVIRADGTVRTYGPETHLLPKDGVSGVAISPAGDVLVGLGIDPRVYVVKDADFTREPIELSPSKIWPTPGAANEAWASATLDGSSVWMVQTVPGADGTHIAVADLVRINDGAVLTSATINLRVFPVGTTHADRLVLDGDQVDAVTLAVDGTIESLGSGTVAAVGARHVAILTNDRRDLVIHEYDGTSRSTTSITPPSRNGRWGLLGIPMIPHVSIPWQTLSPDGRLLIAFWSAGADGSHHWQLYLIEKPDNGDYQSTLLTTDFDFSNAAWTGDHQNVWLLQPGGVRLMRLHSPASIEDMYRLDDEHFILGVG